MYCTRLGRGVCTVIIGIRWYIRVLCRMLYSVRKGTGKGSHIGRLWLCCEVEELSVEGKRLCGTIEDMLKNARKVGPVRLTMVEVEKVLKRLLEATADLTQWQVKLDNVIDVGQGHSLCAEARSKR